MVYRDNRLPGTARMAVFTDVSHLDMCRALAGGVDAIVAAGAIAGDIDVIEVCGRPASRRVTVVTAVTGIKVRLILALGSNAVVA